MYKGNTVDYYTTHTAARKLLVTPTTIIHWIRMGKIKTIKTVGGHRRIPASEIDRIWEMMNKDFEEGRHAKNKNME